MTAEWSRTIELGELRQKLDLMTERILNLFKDRLRLPLNEVIYEPDGVPIEGRPGISLFQFALEGLEAYYASLGRYNYPDQFPVLDSVLHESRVSRVVNQQPLAHARIDVGNDLCVFYVGLVSKYCRQGSDPNTYGSTAYLDARLVELIHERVNIGRYVAEAKTSKDLTIYQAVNDPNLLLVKLKDRTREEELVAKARMLAEVNNLDPQMAEEVFRWMIDTTLFIEISYLQQVVKKDTSAQATLTVEHNTP